MTYIFETVLEISFGASILALLILGARSLIGRRQNALMPVLCALLIAKLIIPLSIESPLSIQNIFNAQNSQTVIQETTIDIGIPQTDLDIAVADITETPSITQTNDVAYTAENTAYQPTLKKAWQPSAMDIAAMVWLVGMLILSACIGISNIRFMRLIKKNRAYTSPGFDELMAECKSAFHIRRNISVIRVSEINTAAVYGIFKPKLLISPHCFDVLSIQEKRHIILHELSHIKRKDTLTCLITTVLNVVHWFNPILWVALLLMRKDLEVMCDTNVLRKIGQSEKHSYATTLFTLIKISSTKNMRLVTALFMNKTSIKRRITMIARYKKRTPLYTALALLLTIVIAVTGCTTSVQDVAEETANTSEEQPQSTEQTGQDEQENGTSANALIGTYSVDFSDYADVESRVHNIEKAIDIIDGAIIPAGVQINFLQEDTIIEENGWETAPSFNWVTLYQTNCQEKNLDQLRVGGGVELVSFALMHGAMVANLDSITSDNPYVGLANWFDANVKIQARIENSNIIVDFYGPNNFEDQQERMIDEMETEQVIEPALMTSFTLDYSIHGTFATYYNVDKALSLLNDIVITPGEQLSLNSILGPRTETNGWKAAAGISGGAFVLQFGGGVSAVSNALYNAAIRAELEIIERRAHSNMSDYVPGGLDATISTGAPDLVIANPYDIDVTINGRREDGNVIIDIYGPPMEYTVDFTSQLTGTGDAPDAVYHYNAENTPDGATLAKGESRTYVRSRGSSTFGVYITLYDTDGNEIETNFFSETTYRAYTGQIYVNGPEPK